MLQTIVTTSTSAPSSVLEIGIQTVSNAPLKVDFRAREEMDWLNSY
jgi:hypothetical protein